MLVGHRLRRVKAALWDAVLLQGEDVPLQPL